tara:strand:- start:4 stop:510 length:507 start_codon:yes stop_codon:yes gene_type:complete
MSRKTKFGFDLGEIIVSTKKQKETKKIKLEEQIVCSICQEYNNEGLIKYVNCKLQGTKDKKIGYYKHCDNPICSSCIVRCEEKKVGDMVRFKFLKKIQYMCGYKYKTCYATGKIIEFYNNIVLIECKNSSEKVSIKNILYKLNTCPWCRSHRLIKWQKNTKKYPKKKK